MQWSGFVLARRVAQSPHHVWLIVMVGIVAAVLVPLLVIDLGLMVQLFAGNSNVPHDWIINPIVSGKLGAWPWFGSYKACLIALVVAGWIIATIECVLLMVLRRAAHGHSLHIAADLRHKIYTQAFRLGPYDLLGATRSRPDELFADKVETIRRGFAQWWIAIPNSLIAVLALIAVGAAVNVWLTLLAVLLTWSVLRFYRAVQGQEETQKSIWREKLLEQETLLRNSLHLAPLLKGYSLVEPPSATFEAALKSHSQAQLNLVRVETFLNPLLSLAVMWAGGFLLLIIGLSPNVSVAGTTVLIGAWLSAYFPFSRLSRLPAVLKEMDTAASDISFFLDREPTVIQLPDAQPLDRLSNRFLFEHVNLADRHGRHLLEDVTITIPAGQRVVVLASDSQTPLALSGLLVRFYDPTAGRILFDEHDVSRATLDTVRGQTALVLKDGLLFPGTLAQNITCGDSGFTSVQINDALKRAGAAEFVRELPQGLATLISDDQKILRPDQAFRIGLARALLRAPSLLVVQEPEDNGDESIGRELDDALLHAAETRTLIILPSRIHTLRSADVIYIFHEGKLFGHGKHADLLQASELYRHLCYVRFNPYRNKVS
jgi:ATP-binding cassette subfamily B protein